MTQQKFKWLVKLNFKYGFKQLQSLHTHTLHLLFNTCKTENKTLFNKQPAYVKVFTDDGSHEVPSSQPQRSHILRSEQNRAQNDS